MSDTIQNERTFENIGLRLESAYHGSVEDSSLEHYRELNPVGPLTITTSNYTITEQILKIGDVVTETREVKRWWMLKPQVVTNSWVAYRLYRIKALRCGGYPDVVFVLEAEEVNHDS